MQVGVDNMSPNPLAFFSPGEMCIVEIGPPNSEATPGEIRVFANVLGGGVNGSITEINIRAVDLGK